ncbi:hypothetical protein KPATCC21470_0385 [Kitasatospora purpeofusca]
MPIPGSARSNNTRCRRSSLKAPPHRHQASWTTDPTDPTDHSHSRPDTEETLH